MSTSQKLAKYEQELIVINERLEFHTSSANFHSKKIDEINKYKQFVEKEIHKMKNQSN